MINYKVIIPYEQVQLQQNRRIRYTGTNGITPRTIDSGFVTKIENPIKKENDNLSYFRISDKGSDLLPLLTSQTRSEFQIYAEALAVTTVGAFALVSLFGV